MAAPLPSTALSLPSAPSHNSPSSSAPPLTALRSVLASIDSTQSAIAATPRIISLLSAVVRSDPLGTPRAAASGESSSALILRSALRLPPGLSNALHDASEWWAHDPDSPAVIMGAHRLEADQPRPEWKEVPKDWSERVDEEMGDGLGVFFEMPGDVILGSGVGDQVVPEELGQVGEAAEMDVDSVTDVTKGIHAKEAKAQVESEIPADPEVDSAGLRTATSSANPTRAPLTATSDLTSELVYIPGWGHVPLREARPIPATA
ncbi:hypothetical protein HDU93_005078, partial [Gonapodya sp. JEL0774]